MTDLERQAMRFEQIERFLASDMPAKQWCKLNHVASSTLYLWMARFREAKGEESISDAIDKKQKIKNTQKWVELNRSDIAGSKALTCVSSNQQVTAKETMAATPTPADIKTQDAVHTSTITVTINNIVVAIPEGINTCYVETVLKAVKSL